MLRHRAADSIADIFMQAEQFTECRIDHYQTPADVHVSVFAKQADKERSTVKIEGSAVNILLHSTAVAC